jgi:hypothetical protein
LTGDTPAGPFPLTTVHEKLAAKEITWETTACPVGAGSWLPLRLAPGIGPAAHSAAPALPPPPQLPRTGSVPSPPSIRAWGWVGLGAAIVVVAVSFIKLVGDKPSQPAVPTVSTVPLPTVGLPPSSPEPGGPSAAAPLAARPRLRVTGRDATPELVELCQGMTPQEALALGLGVALTGTDTYAARVRIANTGNVPVQVFPENVRIHFGGEAVGVTTVNHPTFLQRGVLQPHHYVEGLVTYRARIDVGAAIRLRGGGLSYEDDTVEVTYDP